MAAAAAAADSTESALERQYRILQKAGKNAGNVMRLYNDWIETHSTLTTETVDRNHRCSNERCRFVCPFSSIDEKQTFICTESGRLHRCGLYCSEKYTNGDGDVVCGLVCGNVISGTRHLDGTSFCQGDIDAMMTNENIRCAEQNRALETVFLGRGDDATPRSPPPPPPPLPPISRRSRVTRCWGTQSDDAVLRIRSIVQDLLWNPDRVHLKEIRATKLAGQLHKKFTAYLTKRKRAGLSAHTHTMRAMAFKILLSAGKKQRYIPERSGAVLRSLVELIRRARVRYQCYVAALLDPENARFITHTRGTHQVVRGHFSLDDFIVVFLQELQTGITCKIDPGRITVDCIPYLAWFMPHQDDFLTLGVPKLPTKRNQFRPILNQARLLHNHRPFRHGPPTLTVASLFDGGSGSGGGDGADDDGDDDGDHNNGGGGDNGDDDDAMCVEINMDDDVY
jgi:hypothetical protein